MKAIKLVAFFIMISILSSALAGSVSALTSSELLFAEKNTFIQDNNYQIVEAEDKSLSKKSGVAYTCTYDSKTKRINVSGSVTHEVYISHKEYTLRLYRITPEDTVEISLHGEEATPLAVSEISIKFNFTVDVKSVADIFSRYVVVLVSPQMDVDFIGPELYPSVKSEYVSKINRSFYKGIAGASNSAMLQSSPSVAILPIYLDRLISKGSTGYLYSLDGFSVFFDKAYINDLDRSVRDLSTIGAKVYFQLLLPNESDSLLNLHNSNTYTEYDIPDLSSLTAMNEIYAYCDFLSKRYSSYEYGYIEGMIIGKNLDDTTKYNNIPYSDPEEYAEMLALYGIVVGVATRNNIPSADISFSFSSINSYEDDLQRSVSCDSPDMIRIICSYFDDYYSDDFDFSVTLESYHLPLNITNENILRGIDVSDRDDNRYITEQNMSIFSEFLLSLANTYSSAPQNFMYVWNVDEELSGNALACAYTYLYYKSFYFDKLSSLVVNFADNSASVNDLLNIIKYIDTERSNKVTSVLLQFFEKTSWADVVEGYNTYNYITREYVLLDASPDISHNSSGVYSYFDFSSASTTLSWFEGSGCDDISIDYSAVLGRSLCADFDFDKIPRAEYGYIHCVYEYPENFVFTPYVSFCMSIEGEDEHLDLFEVKIAFGNGSNLYELSQTVHTGEEKNIHIDLSDFSQKYLAEYIRISVRPMSEAKGNYKFNISAIEGKSLSLDNATLEGYINNERMRIRNELDRDEKVVERNDNVLVTVSVLSTAIILGVMLFIFLRRDDQEDK